MFFDPERVKQNAAAATTEDLLDRVTVYRHEMEPVALDIVEAELWRRGIRQVDVDRHEEERRQAGVLARPDGGVRRCAWCDRPASVRVWGWHRLWGKVPLFPRLFDLCPVHAPPPEVSDPESAYRAAPGDED
jgi:hypothetical protein